MRGNLLGKACRMVLVLACLAVAPIVSAAEPVDEPGPISVAPAWSLKTPDGKVVNYPADAQGRPTVLMFWPSWCPFSRALQPYVQTIWEDYRDRGVNVWTINVREDGDPVQTMRDRGLSFPLLLNGDPLMHDYRVQRTPWLVVMDGKQSILYTRPANPPTPIDVAKRVRETLNSLLGDKAVPMPTSYPAPYDLHLRKASDLPDRTKPVAIPDSEWQAWVQHYAAGIGPDETVGGAMPGGPVANGKAAIMLARQAWAARYGVDAVNAQAPYRAYRKDRLWIVVGQGLSTRLGEGLIFVIAADTGRFVRIADSAEIAQ